MTRPPTSSAPPSTAKLGRFPRPSQSALTWGGREWTLQDAMDADENLPRRKDDLPVQLGTQDLDPFSVEELEERIALLEAEIVRTKTRMQRAVNHRASADALFKR